GAGQRAADPGDEGGVLGGARARRGHLLARELEQVDLHELDLRAVGVGVSEVAAEERRRHAYAVLDDDVRRRGEHVAVRAASYDGRAVTVDGHAEPERLEVRLERSRDRRAHRPASSRSARAVIISAGRMNG